LMTESSVFMTFILSNVLIIDADDSNLLNTLM